MTEFEFTYDPKLTQKENFRVWYQLNCQERGIYNEPMMSIENAIRVFNGSFQQYVEEAE